MGITAKNSLKILLPPAQKFRKDKTNLIREISSAILQKVLPHVGFGLSVDYLSNMVACMPCTPSWNTIRQKTTQNYNLYSVPRIGIFSYLMVSIKFQD